MLIRQVNNGAPSVEIQYRRAVGRDGNLLARRLMSEVFEACDAPWRGFGIIPGSGLRLRKEFEDLMPRRPFLSVLRRAKKINSASAVKF